MAPRLAYNTNGFPQHALPDVARILAALGYDGIAITPDVFHLNPLADGLRQARALRPALEDLGLAVAVETGARFLLDPRRKHQPTLLSAGHGAARRLDLLLRCHEIAVALRAETFSFWSGAWAPAGTSADGASAQAKVAPAAGATKDAAPSPDEALDRLCAGAATLLDHCAGSGVTTCFEPEPGMAVASLADWERFSARLGRPELRLMLDVGHVPVTETISPAQAVASQASRLGGLQLDDARPGVHEHLAPGDGCIAWPALFAAVEAAGFGGLCSFELPRHGHDPVQTARRALAFARGA